MKIYLYLVLKKNKFKQLREILILIALASSEDSDKPAHTHSFARVITARTHKVETYMRIQAKVLTASSHMLAAHACLNSDACLNGDTAHVRLVPKSRVLVIMLCAFSFQGNKTA